ncbi:MAG: metallophosphoesterase [Acidobacteriota bacterium]
MLKLLTLLILAGQPVQAQLRIGIIGDQTGAADLGQAYNTLQQGIEKLRQQGRFDVFLHTGDLLESSRPEDQVRRDFQRAVGLLNQLPAPWHMTPGDHDVNPPFRPGRAPDRSRQELFKLLYSKLQPQVRDRLYYSFDVKGYHFIALDSLEHLGTDPRWGNVFRARLGEEQLRWLEADLKPQRGCKGIIVFTHQPLWYNWGSWERVHRLLSQYPVRAVIAGHFHYSQRDALLDGIQYLVVGATGGRLKNASASAGSLQAVYELTVNGKEVDVRILPLSGSSAFAPPSRHDMDRVQAVDSVLDLLNGFSAANSVHWQEGEPRVSCGEAQPARLTLRQVGNPIDLPLNLEVSLESDQVQVDRSRFLPGVCLDEPGPFKCRLAPGINIGISNTSMVELNSFAPVTIWEATLAAQTEPGSSGRINLSLRMSFADQSGGTMLLYRAAEVKIRPCMPQ